MSREPIAAELRREAQIGSGMIGLQRQLRGHAGHRVDLAAELRHEETVHDAVRRQPEMYRRARGYDKPIEARYAFIGIDEQPFPIERNDFDFDRLHLRV